MSLSPQITNLDFAIIALYVGALLAIGFYVSFRKGHSEDLFLGGRNLRWPFVGLSIFGTNISPSMLIAYSGVAYASGMVAANFEWLAWIFLMLLAMVFVPHYLRTKITTMPEFISMRFDNKCRSFLAWYTILSAMWMWIGGMLYVGGLILSQTIGIPLWVSILCLAVIATSFTVTGGLAAVVVTDAFQMVFLILVSTLLSVIGIYHAGGVGALLDGTPDSFWSLLRPTDDPNYPWHAILLGYPVMGVWFFCTDQTIVQRVLGARDIQQGQFGCAAAGFLKIISPLVFFIPGIACRVLHPDLPNADDAYITMVINYMPVGATGLIVGSLMAALISSVDSGLNSLSTVFTLDVYRRNFRPDATPAQLKKAGRTVTIVTAALSIGFAFLMQYLNRFMNLFDLGQTLISFLAPTLAVVFLAGVLSNRPSAKAAYLTLAFGGALSLVTGIFYVAKWPNEDLWPHFMLVSFYLFVVIAVFLCVLTLIYPNRDPEARLPSLWKTMRAPGNSTRLVWGSWLLLGICMTIIYTVMA